MVVQKSFCDLFCEGILFVELRGTRMCSEQRALYVVKATWFYTVLAAWNSCFSTTLPLLTLFSNHWKTKQRLKILSKLVYSFCCCYIHTRAHCSGRCNCFTEGPEKGQVQLSFSLQHYDSSTTLHNYLDSIRLCTLVFFKLLSVSLFLPQPMSDKRLISNPMTHDNFLTKDILDNSLLVSKMLLT